MEKKNKKTKPYFTYIIIIINILIFIIINKLDYKENLIYDYALTKEKVLKGETYRLITYMFFHLDKIHIFSNMFFLYIFGKELEEMIGNLEYIVLYLFLGIFSAIFTLFFSTSYIVGASGVLYRNNSKFTNYIFCKYKKNEIIFEYSNFANDFMQWNR